MIDNDKEYEEALDALKIMQACTTEEMAKNAGILITEDEYNDMLLRGEEVKFKMVKYKDGSFDWIMKDDME